MAAARPRPASASTACACSGGQQQPRRSPSALRPARQPPAAACVRLGADSTTVRRRDHRRRSGCGGSDRGCGPRGKDSDGLHGIRATQELNHYDSGSSSPPRVRRPLPRRRRFAAALLPRLFGNNVPGHTTRAPSVGFELATNGIQFYAIARGHLGQDIPDACVNSPALGEGGARCVRSVGRAPLRSSATAASTLLRSKRGCGQALLRSRRFVCSHWHSH